MEKLKWEINAKICGWSKFMCGKSYLWVMVFMWHHFKIKRIKNFYWFGKYLSKFLSDFNSPFVFSRAVSKALLREFTVDSENKKHKIYENIRIKCTHFQVHFQCYIWDKAGPQNCRWHFTWWRQKRRPGKYQYQGVGENRNEESTSDTQIHIYTLHSQ